MRRCRINGRYRPGKRGMARLGMAGVIVGESRDGTCWWMILHGMRSKICMHKSFVDEEEENEQRPDPVPDNAG